MEEEYIEDKHICESFPVEYCPECQTFFFERKKEKGTFEEIVMPGKGISEGG